MDLYYNEHPSFTRWVVANELLREPFVVIDVGVQGGAHARWQHLGKFVHVHGFDAIREVVDALKAVHDGQATRSYHAMALGNEDGQREFYVAADTYGSSFFCSDRSQTGQQNGIALGSRRVDIRRLDTLFADGTLPPADYIKLDCEGFEPEILQGGKAYLARSNVLCVEVETNFGVSPVYWRTPFADINDLLVAYRLLVFDVNLVRVARPSYTAARAASPWPHPDPMRDTPDLQVGQPRTFDFLFCRDLVGEHTHADGYVRAHHAPPPTPDKLIKSMINFELHGLMDCAVDIAEHFRPVLAPRLDVDVAIRHLVSRPTHTRNIADVRHAMAMIDELRQHVGRSLAQVHAAEHDRDMKVAAAEHDRDMKLAAAERDRDMKLAAAERDRDLKLRSFRFLAKALAREAAARVRTRLGGTTPRRD